MKSADDWFWEGFGFLFSYNGKYEEAIFCFSKVIEIMPNHESSYNNRGSAYFYLQKYQLAIDDYTKIIVEINPKSEDAYHNRGNAYSRLKKYQLAINDLNKALEINSKFDLPYSKLGQIYNVIYSDFYKANKCYSAFIFYNIDKKYIVKNFEDLLPFYTDHHDQPFLVQNLLKGIDVSEFTTYKDTAKKTAKKCATPNFFLSFLNIKKEWKVENKLQQLRIQAFIHYLMGDTPTAYRLFCQLDKDGEDGFYLDFKSHYYLNVCAQTCMIQDETILENSINEAEQYLEQREPYNPHDLYYIAQLFILKQDFTKAKAVLSFAVDFLPARYLAYSLDKQLGNTSTWLAKEIIEKEMYLPPSEQYLQGVSKKHFQTEGDDLESQFLPYIYYQEVQNLCILEELTLSDKPYAYLRFWEAFDFENEIDIKKQVYWYEFQAYFKEFVAKNYQNHSETEKKQIESDLTKKFETSFNTLERIYGKNPNELKNELIRKIENWEKSDPNIYYMLISYYHSVVVPAALTEEDIVYLHLYIMYQKYHKKEGMKDLDKTMIDGGLQEFWKNTLTSTGAITLANVFNWSYIGMILSPISILLASKIIAGFQNFAPTMSYEDFNKQLQKYIIEERETLGEEAFYKKYDKV